MNAFERIDRGLRFHDFRKGFFDFRAERFSDDGHRLQCVRHDLKLVLHGGREGSHRDALLRVGCGDGMDRKIEAKYFDFHMYGK
ncbi:hypothetical protein [Caballeronia concitans]|uniref:hypothetical protein n=1 Tax=Caballeronia concitans TaxID=1777133 RepID=UPI00117BF728|nr:hypothetical protein [Caballeronia concitans]